MTEPIAAVVTSTLRSLRAAPRRPGESGTAPR